MGATLPVGTPNKKACITRCGLFYLARSWRARTRAPFPITRTLNSVLYPEYGEQNSGYRTEFRVRDKPLNPTPDSIALRN